MAKLTIMIPVVCAVLTACDPVAAPVSKLGSSCSAKNQSGSGLASSSASSKGCPAEAQSPNGKDPREIPDLGATAANRPGFNSTPIKLSGPLPEEYKKKELVAAPMDAYLALWLDYRNESSSAKISLWKPRSLLLSLPSSDEILEFMPVGHTMVRDRAVPTHKTMMVTNNPTFEAGETPKEYMKRPDDYTLVFTRLGRLTIDDLKKCEDVYEKGFINHELYWCEAFMRGLLQGGSLNRTTLTFNNGMQDLYDKQTVAVWRPVCPADYQALGFSATNSSGKKPVSDQDHVHSPVGQRYSQVAAQYCVHKDLVVKGKLGDGYRFDNVTFHEIVPEDPAKGVSAGMFYVYEGELKETPQVWVLSRDHVIYLEDPK